MNGMTKENMMGPTVKRRKRTNVKFIRAIYISSKLRQETSQPFNFTKNTTQKF